MAVWIIYDEAFIDAYKNGEEMPIDTYDAVAWMVITAGRINCWGESVAIPDFTRGNCLIRKER